MKYTVFWTKAWSMAELQSPHSCEWMASSALTMQYFLQTDISRRWLTFFNETRTSYNPKYNTVVLQFTYWQVSSDRKLHSSACMVYVRRIIKTFKRFPQSVKQMKKLFKQFYWSIKRMQIFLNARANRLNVFAKTLIECNFFKQISKPFKRCHKQFKRI